MQCRIEPAIPLLDTAEIVAGEIHVQPTFTGAAPGFAGVAVSKFRVATLPAASTVELRITVNGQDSNTVLSPCRVVRILTLEEKVWKGWK